MRFVAYASVSEENPVAHVWERLKDFVFEPEDVIFFFSYHEFCVIFPFIYGNWEFYFL